MPSLYLDNAQTGSSEDVVVHLGFALDDGVPQVLLLHGVDGHLRVRAPADALRELPGVDQDRPVDVFGQGREAGGQDEHVGVELKLPVARVAQVELAGADE